MPIPTPFHERTSALCTSLQWKDWAGYYAVCSFDTSHEREYYALRHAAGLIDVSPLFKYEVTGPDAGALLAQVMVKDVRQLELGQASYLCWCDDAGHVIDDGTVTRMGEDHYRVTAAEPTWAWLQRFRRGYDVELEDSTSRIGALSLQGPFSRAVLADCCDADVDGLGFFRGVEADLGGTPVWISRTGYTGDLGFEVWVDSDKALPAWDAIMSAGRSHGIEAAALDAMDVTRVEAGFIMNGVDYYSAHHCMTDGRKSTPYELGLGWTVQLDRDRFKGQAALRAEKERGPARRFVGLVLDWDEFEGLYAEHGLPPEVCSHAWRDGVPVYAKGGRQVGKATSGAWSPLLKQDLALADVEAEVGKIGTQLDFEVTVEYERRRVTATVTRKPFFDPERKRS